MAFWTHPFSLPPLSWSPTFRPRGPSNSHFHLPKASGSLPCPEACAAAPPEGCSSDLQPQPQAAGEAGVSTTSTSCHAAKVTDDQITGGFPTLFPTRYNVSAREDRETRVLGLPGMASRALPVGSNGWARAERMGRAVGEEPLEPALDARLDATLELTLGASG